MLDDFFLSLDEKIDNLNEKIDILGENTKEIEILSVTDITKILGCNRNTVNKLFQRDDFPKIRGIKSRKVEKQAFYKWLQNSEKERFIWKKSFMIHLKLF